MVHTLFVLQLTVLVIFSGFRAIHSETDGGSTEESSGDCGTILTTLQMSQKQLDKVDDTVRSITPQLKDNIELGFYKLLEKIEHFIERKFDEFDKKMDSKFHDTKTFMESKLSVIEDKISEYTSRIDSKITGLESTITHALNVSDTLNNNNACCQASLETAAFLKNTSTKINDIVMRTLNMSARLNEMNETIQNLNKVIVPAIDNNISSVLNSTTEPARNVPDIITTTEVNKPASSKCDRSQQEECCTAAVVGEVEYTVYTDMMSARRHTVMNMTSAGLQEYTMYFAVRGRCIQMVLSPTSPQSDQSYEIGLTDASGGYIDMNEYPSTNVVKVVQSFYIANTISIDSYSYYYVSISGDTLKVGRRGEPPLMTHTSTGLRKLMYFSFKRWCSATDAALYDCTAE